MSLADQLEPVLTARHFKRSGAKSFTRRRGSASDRVGLELARGTCRVSLTVTDKAISPSWRAGGPFDERTFRDVPDLDISVPASARRLVMLITKSLAFFDLAATPAKLLAEAQRRYVPGFVEPTTIAPFLRAYLGAEAVVTYVDAVLRGRPELWPGFLGVRTKKLAASRGVSPDHGSQLAAMLAPGEVISEPPSRTVIATKPTSANLRSHFGLQLRAWGEPDAAGKLRTLEDATIDALSSERSTVDDADYAARVLAATGTKRHPARRSPKPLFYQYEVLHGPWVR